jgi:hypothetical protein
LPGAAPGLRQRGVHAHTCQQMLMEQISRQLRLSSGDALPALL